MDAPSVQYVTTSDGWSIAYTVSGEGRPFVFMPVGLNHAQDNWRSPVLGPWLEGLSQRFRLINYDSRGHGMSGRGLPEDFALADYERDLEAVVERLQLERFVLLGVQWFGHVAARYAVRHPEHIDALVLLHCAVTMEAFPLALQVGLARENWDLFLQFVAASATPEQTRASVERFHRAISQADWLIISRAMATSDIGGLLPRLRVPTLLLHARDFAWLGADEAAKVAGRVPNARLTLIEGSSQFGDAASGVQAIEEFLKGLQAGQEERRQLSTRAALPDGLSAREVEVLRLITAGKSNQQIAAELVITLNTVQHHVSNILTKTGLASRGEAAAYAHRHGLV